VRNTLFPSLECIMADAQMEEYSAKKHSLCYLICQPMGLKEAMAAVMWREHYKNVIAYVLNAKWAYVTGALKQAFKRAYQICFACINTQTSTHIPHIVCINIAAVLDRMRSNRRFYDLDKFLQLSTGGTPYEWVCTTLFPFFVGYKKWNKRYLKENMNMIVTCSDKAFVLLTLENNYDRWMTEAKWHIQNDSKPPSERNPKELPEAKYTNRGKSKQNGQSKCLHGWSREGYLRFNDIVSADRKNWIQFETTLQTTWKSMQSNPKAHTKTVPVADNVFPANDLPGLLAPLDSYTRTVRDTTEDNHDDPYDLDAE
jgi:hypothetical protein